MATIKIKKEIQLAALNFIQILDQQKVDAIKGTFLPADSSYLYQRQQRNLAYCLLLSAVCLYAFVYVMIVEKNYYTQLDTIGVISIVSWLLLVLITGLLTLNYFKGNRHLKTVLKNPNDIRYGIIITDEYYFERQLDQYHIIAKSNIVRIDYEEQRKSGAVYLELLLDLDNQYEVRGLLYHPDEYDIKAWLAGVPTAIAPTSDL